MNPRFRRTCQAGLAFMIIAFSIALTALFREHQMGCAGEVSVRKRPSTESGRCCATPGRVVSDPRKPSGLARYVSIS